MEVSYRYIRLRLSEAGILPRSRMARVAWYLLGIDIALFALQKLLGLFHVSYGRSLADGLAFSALLSLFSSLSLLSAGSGRSCCGDCGTGSLLRMCSSA